MSLDDRKRKTSRKPPSASPAAPRKSAVQSSQEEFERRARQFRAAIRATAAHVADDMEAAVETLLRDASAISPAIRRRKFCEDAARRIAELPIKPHKARVRDLRRIDKLLAQLSHDIAEYKS